MIIHHPRTIIISNSIAACIQSVERIKWDLIILFISPENAISPLHLYRCIQNVTAAGLMFRRIRIKWGKGLQIKLGLELGTDAAVGDGAVVRGGGKCRTFSPRRVGDSPHSPDLVFRSENCSDLVFRSENCPVLVYRSENCSDLVFRSENCSDLVYRSENCPILALRSENCPVLVYRSENCSDLVFRSENCPDLVFRSENCPVLVYRSENCSCLLYTSPSPRD